MTSIFITYIAYRGILAAKRCGSFWQITKEFVVNSRVLEQIYFERSEESHLDIQNNNQEHKNPNNILQQAPWHEGIKKGWSRRSVTN
jgi:hypothetical protein